jgi:hypothetical protein
MMMVRPPIVGSEFALVRWTDPQSQCLCAGTESAKKVKMFTWEVRQIAESKSGGVLFLPESRKSVHIIMTIADAKVTVTIADAKVTIAPGEIHWSFFPLVKVTPPFYRYYRSLLPLVKVTPTFT